MSQPYQPCEICIDEQCGGTNSCHCKTCSHVKECRKYLHPTIRITTKCTQACSHCCFSCKPENTRHMTRATAQNIAQFLKNNHIISLNVMGGEFFCNTNWYDILSEWFKVNCHIRLVSNGDWACNPTVKAQLLKLHHLYPDQFHISISNDKFHTNQYIIEANTFLNNYGFDYNIGGTSQDTEDTLLPLGNAQDIYNLYSFGVCYCHNPQHQYSFMIDETGDIYKCSFGVLQYDNIQNFTSGGFAARFKEFNKKFYHIFLPSCTSCIRYCTTENAIAPNN